MATGLFRGDLGAVFGDDENFRPRPQQMIQALGHGLPDLWYQVAALLNGASPLSWLNGILQGGTIQSLLQRTQRRYRRDQGAFCFCPISTASARRITTLRRGRPFTACMQARRWRIWRWRFLKVWPCRWRIARMFWSRAARGWRNCWWRAAARAAPSGCSLLANVLNRRITIPKGSEVGAAFGAARLARLSVTGEAIAEVCSKPKALLHLETEQKLSKAYADRLGDFRALYGALKGTENV